MDKDRQKNGNAERSLKYKVFYTTKSGKKAFTRYTGKDIDDFIKKLENAGNKNVSAIPDVKIKE